MNPTPKPSPKQPDPASAATPEPNTRPLYFCGFSTSERYTDDGVHNPIGIPGSVYASPIGAMQLYYQSVAGRIPLNKFQADDEIWLHFPTGVIAGLSRADSARFLSAEWMESVRSLVRTMVQRGMRVCLYIGSMQDTPVRMAAEQALVEYTKQCADLRCGLIVDAAATERAAPFRDGLVHCAKVLRSKNLPFGVEGMWSPGQYVALHELIAYHLVEINSVKASFDSPDHPGWDGVVAPDPSKVVVWDQRGNFSTEEAAMMMAALPLYKGPSAIGADRWRVGTPGNPRLAVSRQDDQGRKVLSVLG